MTLVTCIGLAVEDLVYGVPRLPNGPGKIHASQLTRMGGGPAATAAVAIARLGGEARLVSPLGSDLVGDSILAEIASEGVDTSTVRRVEGVPSPISSVAVDADGDRSIINYSSPELFRSAPQPVPREFEGSKAVLVDVRWQNGAEAGLKWARDNGIPGVVDLDAGHSDVRPLLDSASHVVFAAAALKDLTGITEPSDALSQVASLTEAFVAVTVGEAGVWWHTPSGTEHMPAFPVSVVDTTGAGDVFHGAFALALTRGEPEAGALRFASAAAALSCSGVGGRSAIPDHEELRVFLDSQS